jgi:undecaprenyl-diphosphatase
VNVPPDDNPVVTRTRAARAVPAAVATVAGCLVVLALLGAGVRTDFGPQLRLDAAVSEALYVGDHRAPTLNGLLDVLTAPGVSWFRFLVFLPVLALLVRRRAWWTAAWLVTAVGLIGPLTSLLKVYFGRVRPDFAQGGARLESLS